MRFLASAAFLLCLAAIGSSSLAEDFNDVGQTISEQLKAMRQMVGGFGNQMMMLQHLLEERTRASGKSGVKTVRLRGTGTKNFYGDSHTSAASLSIHDHSNNRQTLGMGEFSLVMNGAELRTRHNDYKMVQPSRTDQGYHRVQDIEFPDVPQSVLDKKTVEEQIKEMAEYFRAWRDQDKKHRDYTNYFKAILCYLEGAWNNATEKFEEPFASDRHRLDASSWSDLLQKVRFAAYSGTKSRFENLAFLPTSVLTTIGGVPQLAQFNYRILCHPLAKEVPLKALRVVDDFHLRMRSGRNILQHERSRQARFRLGASDDEFQNGPFKRGMLDELMEEIPGKNNHPGVLADEGLDIPAYDPDGKTKKNAGRYHRMYYYPINARDASGVSVAYRGWNDDHLFSALTTHEEVASMTVQNRQCRWIAGKGRVCQPLTQRWSWAMPLELVFLTPLHKWNPYNIEFKGEANSDSGKTVSAGGLNGVCGQSKDYNGINSRVFYMTPVEFFGSWHSAGSADTVRGSVCVKDKSGVVRKVQASGVRTFLPQIGDVGSLRTRFPIFPVHEEGSTTWKELEALRDLVMDKELQQKLVGLPAGGQFASARYLLQHQHWYNLPVHSHSIQLSVSQQRSLAYGAVLTLTTDGGAAHSHSLQLKYNIASGQLQACVTLPVPRATKTYRRCDYMRPLQPLAVAN